MRELEAAVKESEQTGTIGIAHTRWATHGVPAERNAHPHMSGPDVAVVHNGIIERRRCKKTVTYSSRKPTRKWSPTWCISNWQKARICWRL